MSSSGDRLLPGSGHRHVIGGFRDPSQAAVEGRPASPRTGSPRARHGSRSRGLYRISQRSCYRCLEVVALARRRSFRRPCQYSGLPITSEMTKSLTADLANRRMTQHHPADREQNVNRDAKCDRSSQPAHPGCQCQSQAGDHRAVRRDQSQQQDVLDPVPARHRPGNWSSRPARSTGKEPAGRPPTISRPGSNASIREWKAGRRGCRVPAPRPGWWRRSRSGAAIPPRPETRSCLRSNPPEFESPRSTICSDSTSPEHTQAAVYRPRPGAKTVSVVSDATRATGPGCRRAMDLADCGSHAGRERRRVNHQRRDLAAGCPACFKATFRIRSVDRPTSRPERPRQTAKNTRYVVKPTLPGSE